MNTYIPLRATDPQSGDFVLENQELATDESFPNVSRCWFEKTRSFDDVREEAAQQKAERQDVSLRLRDFVLESEAGVLRVTSNSGRTLFPNQYATQQLGQLARVPVSYTADLFKHEYEGDQDMLAHAIEHGLGKP